MFFDKPWSDVSDDDIAELSSRLAEEMGGWVFHSKVDFNQKTPHLNLSCGQPKLMLTEQPVKAPVSSKETIDDDA